MSLKLTKNNLYITSSDWYDTSLMSRVINSDKNNSTSLSSLFSLLSNAFLRCKGAIRAYFLSFYPWAYGQSVPFLQNPY